MAGRQEAQAALPRRSARRRRRACVARGAGEAAGMFPTQEPPAHLRRQTAGETLALRSRRKAARSDFQLARLQGEHLSEVETHAATEVSGDGVAVSSVQ